LSSIVETGLSTIMGILSTRSSSGKFPDQAKSDTNVANNEIDLSPDGGTQDQDEADMTKLGMRQQTKVSRWMYPSKNRYKHFTDCTIREDLD
jgi:hypothetical protein